MTVDREVVAEYVVDSEELFDEVGDRGRERSVRADTEDRTAVSLESVSIGRSAFDTNRTADRN